MNLNIKIRISKVLELKRSHSVSIIKRSRNKTLAWV